MLNENISSKNMDLINNMKFNHELYISGRLVSFFHATPKSTWDNVLAFEKIDI